MATITTTEARKAKITRGVLRFLSLKITLISSLFISSLFVFAYTINEVFYEKEQAFDNRVFSFFSSMTTESMISAMKFFTFFGSDSFLLPAYLLIIAIFIFYRKFRYAIHIAIIALSSTALMLAIKQITRRHRPDLPIIKGISNYSFPSGHALSVFIFCGIIVYIIWHSQATAFFKWLLSVLLLCFTVTVGISRIILKVHFPTDVVASFCLGTLWAVSSLWVLKKISKKQIPDRQ